MTTVRARITSALIQLGVSADDIHADKTLDELGLDSLARLELATELGLADDEASTATTVAKITDLLTSKETVH